jgi:protocatechuate 3,4-dioxygenase beta subunit
MSRVLFPAVTLVCALAVVAEAQFAPLPPPPPPPPAPARDASALPPRDATPRTGTSRISGRVTDAATGRPIRRASVRLTGASQARVTSTDANGNYEFANLPAGQYQAMASKANYVQLSYGQTRVQEVMRPFPLADKQTLERIDFALPRAGVITGRVVDELGEPVTDVVVAPMRQQYSPAGRRPVPSGRTVNTNDIGEFRLYGLNPGDYVISASYRNQPGFTEATVDRSGYAPTYYPSATTVADAQPIRVAVGQTISDITVVLSLTTTATLSGMVVDADGQPLRGGSVSAMPRSAVPMPMMGGNGPIRPDGTFSISGVVPGQYMLRASGGGPQPLIQASGTVVINGVVTNMSPGANRSESIAFVDVNGQDVGGIVLAPQKPATITGRFTGDQSALAMVRPGMTRVSAQPAAVEDLFAVRAVIPPATVSDDLTFALQAAPGRTLIRPTGMGAASLKAIYYQGVDITDTPIELRDGDTIRDLEIELTTKVQQLSGMVTDARGAVPPNFSVVLFASDAEKWRPPTRHVMVARPNAEGRYTMRLPAGDYYAAAVDYVEPGQWTDPEFLESLRGRATRFTIGEGETRTLDLRLSTP